MTSTLLKENEFTEQKANWLELFYDVAYVAAIAQLTYMLVNVSGTLIEYAQFTFLLMMIFYSWMGNVVFQNTTSNNESKLLRVLTLVQMFFALFMSVFLHEAFGAGDVGFILGYVGTRVIFNILMARDYKINPETTPKQKNFLWASRIAIIIWVVSLFLPTPIRYGAWIAALVLEFFAPQTQGIFSSKNVQNPIRIINKYHLPERLGLFVILVMGESFIVVAVVNNIASGLLSITNGLITAATFLMISGVWWLYFEHVERFAKGKSFSLIPFIYSHIPIVAGIMLIAAGTKMGILDKGYGPDPLMLLVSGLVVTLVGFNILKISTGQSVMRLFWPTIIFALFVATGAFFNSLPFLTALYILAAFFGIYIFLENKECGEVRAGENVTLLKRVMR